MNKASLAFSSKRVQFRQARLGPSIGLDRAAVRSETRRVEREESWVYPKGVFAAAVASACRKLSIVLSTLLSPNANRGDVTKRY